MKRLITTALVGLLMTTGLVACIVEPEDPTGISQSAGPTDATSGSIAVVDVIENLNYYYACGNENLTLPDGRTFYPLHFEDQETFDDSRYEIPPQALDDLTATPGMTAVAPPSPGDDTGRLIIFEDGMALWVSDSGSEAWLTEEPQQYNWDC